MAAKKNKKIYREISELISALEQHTKTLKEFYIAGCVNNDPRYIKEITGKLRLLVCRSPHNTPLLSELMKKFNVSITIKFNKPWGSEEKDLEDYLNSLCTVVRVPSGELVELTYTQFVALWAQQSGSSHEDWSQNEELVTILNSGLYIGDLSIASKSLCTICKNIIYFAENFLDTIRNKKLSF